MKARAEPAFSDEQKLIDYLLGRLGENERVEIETRLFTHEEVNDELLATADDLIHAYLAGALGADDRALVEAELLSLPRYGERMEFIRAMMIAAERVTLADADGGGERPILAPIAPHRRWGFVVAAAAAAVVLVIAGALDRFSPPPSEGPIPMRMPVPSMPASPSAEDRAPSRYSDEGEVRTIRMPTEGDAPVEVSVAAGTRVVRLLLRLPERPSYDAVVRAADGVAVWRARGIPPVGTGRRVTLAIPARFLIAGRYTLRVQGESLRDAPAPPFVVDYRLDVIQAR